MLNIQKFILEHEDSWRELLTKPPYNLIIKENTDLVLFKYSQISSDFNEPICREARGLILEKNTWKVVRIAFFKFFNVGEIYADKIDWQNCTATSKEDGSLISVYFYNGWKVATNNTINASDAELHSGFYHNFRELFDAAAQNSHLDYDRLDPRYTYTFELCSKFNQIVVSYGEPKLYHILTRNNTTLEEEEVDIGVEKPKFYNLNSEEEYQALVNTFDETHEGIVIKDIHNNRVKLKTPLYFKLHRMIGNNSLTIESIMDIIIKNEQGEFLAYFPQYSEFFGQVEHYYRCAKFSVLIAQDMVCDWKMEHPNAARSEFAKFAKAQEIPHVFFKLYDGTNAIDWFNTLSAKQILSLFPKPQEEYLTFLK